MKRRLLKLIRSGMSLIPLGVGGAILEWLPQPTPNKWESKDGHTIFDGETIIVKDENDIIRCKIGKLN